jgi:hypothetical protein
MNPYKTATAPANLGAIMPASAVELKEDVREIGRLTAEINEACTGLEHFVEQLEARLQPVLSAMGPATPSATAPRPICDTALGQCLEDNRRRIRDAAERIGQLNVRARL